MAQSSQPTQVIHLGGFPTSPAACRLASGAHSGQPKSFCHAECLNEEPDVGKPLVRFCEGLRHNRCRAEILWHRRETRRQTENTNVMPIALEGLILLDKYPNALLFHRLRLYHDSRFNLNFMTLSPILILYGRRLARMLEVWTGRHCSGRSPRLLTKSSGCAMRTW